MIPRSVALPVLLAASVAVPYVATNGPQWNLGPDSALHAPNHGRSRTASRQSSLVTNVLDPADNHRMTPQGPGLYPTQTPLEGIPTYALQEVLRMDVSKEWVYQRWARKSTTTADLQWFGIRVPLVSGAQISDVAGALTYYFDAAGAVQKLTLVGRTGDTSQIVNLAAGPFGLTRRDSPPGEQLFQGYRDADVISELRTRPAPVLWESNPHESFSVDLTLQRLESGRPIRRDDLALQKLLKQQQDAIAEQEKKALAEAEKKEKAKASAARLSKVAEDDPKDLKKWNLFFPRRRVPKPQIEGLEKRRILW